ncbi:Transcriptional regulator of acetoin/glycerol metabolism [Leucobacter chromiiresistens]|uniref:Transcriptional regulator of acetoin/glycerol metabolism n=2 Tax=Leucobacter chromiiresistens TaxID=1079994 RepID=A0A1H0Y2F5_9MICO|nr:Transcriptional regulator of acetoin/glycerol metabolism [Leucobacter chromiiresistens]
MTGQAVGTTRRVQEWRAADRARDSILESLNAEIRGVRPMIARSWYRSRAAGVDASADRGMLDAGRVDEHTLSAAEPHLRKLDEVASDLGGYVSLTAPNGALIHPSFLRADDSFPEGYSLLEESCGSNGEGLALEEGRGVWLAPEEHFREDMRGNWCFGSLVRDPFHNRVRAVVGLTFPEARVSHIDPGSTLLMLEGVSSRIEHDIATRTSSKERALLDEYLTVTRRRGDTPIIAMDGKNSLMNSAATTRLQENDLAIVEGYAKSVMSTGRSSTATVSLSGIGAAELTLTAVQLSGASVGAIVTVRPRPEQRALRSAASGIIELEPVPQSFALSQLRQRLVGASSEFETTLALAARAVEQSRSAVIIGEAGTGKRRIAGAIAALRGSSVFVDARHRNNALSLAEEVAQSLGANPDTIVIGHADELSQLDGIDIVRAIGAHPTANVILTAQRATPTTLRISEFCGALELEVAPLRNRREDIPLLAQAIAADLGDKTLSRKMLSALMNSDWERNIEQLRSVVINAVERARGGEATMDDLPISFQRVASTGRLSRLEEAEYSELRSALREAQGNRRLTASMLQIGRSTLYRRMDFFRSRGLDL